MLWSGSEELHADEYLGAKITFFFPFLKLISWKSQGMKVIVLCKLLVVCPDN